MPLCFWSTDIDNWTSNEQRRSCLSLLCTLSKTRDRIHPQLNILKYPANIHNVSLRTFVECIQYGRYQIILQRLYCGGLGRRSSMTTFFRPLGGTELYILVKISKLPLDFVNRKSCCSQFYRIIISLTYTTAFNKPQYMHFWTNSTQDPVLIVMIRWYPYFSKSHLGHFRT